MRPFGCCPSCRGKGEIPSTTEEDHTRQGLVRPCPDCETYREIASCEWVARAIALDLRHARVEKALELTGALTGKLTALIEGESK